MRNAGRRSASLLIALLATGCGGGAQKEAVTTPARLLELESLTFRVKAGVNANRPVRVELVRVRDADQVRELTRIDPAAWFQSAGEAFCQAHPDAFCDDWELVPGRRTGPFDMAVDEKVAGVLFCESLTGAPPLRMVRNGDVMVVIEDDGCAVRGGEPVREPVREPSRWNPLNWW